MFFIFQIIITLISSTVCPFTGDTAEYVDCCIYIFAFCRFPDRITCRHDKWCCTVNRKEIHCICTVPCSGKNVILPVLTCLIIDFVIAVDPFLGSHLKTDIFHSLTDRDFFSLINITRTGTALDRLPRSCTINSNCTSCF